MPKDAPSDTDKDKDDLGNPPLMATTGSMTWSAWVRPNSLPSSWGVLAANYGGNYQGWYVGLHASGRLIFSLATLPSSAPWRE